MTADQRRPRCSPPVPWRSRCSNRWRSRRPQRDRDPHVGRGGVPPAGRGDAGHARERPAARSGGRRLPGARAGPQPPDRALDGRRSGLPPRRAAHRRRGVDRPGGKRPQAARGHVGRRRRAASSTSSVTSAVPGDGIGTTAVCAVARGNIVLAHHAMTGAPGRADGPRPATVATGRQRGARSPGRSHSAASTGGRRCSRQDPRQCTPLIELTGGSMVWRPRLDLLASDRFDQGVVVELESDGRAHLRFGDDIHGMAPSPHDHVRPPPTRSAAAPPATSVTTC